MSFKELQAKVGRAEDTLEAHERRIAANLRVFGDSWREAWTPPRLVAAGLAAGFLAGWARPARAITGIEPARWLQLAGSLAGLASSVHAAFTAADAQDAAEEAGEAAAASSAAAGLAAGATSAGTAASTPTTASAASPSERRYAPDPSWDAPPRPAEAATEVSERR